MIKHVSKFALAATALVALPGAAQAGTSTDTGAASMTVINQCSVTGANVNLGTYTTNQTWGDIGQALGSNPGDYRGGYSPGTLGQEYMNFGSVTCDSGTPYTLSITSSFMGEAISLNLGEKTGIFVPMIKKIGSATVADVSWGWTGAGGYAPRGVAGTGTGAAQALLGSVILDSVLGWSAQPTDRLATAGTVSDTLNYTLTF